MALLSVKQFIEQTLKKFSVDPTHKQIFNIWQEQFKDKGDIFKIKGGDIVIEVNNSVLLQELTLKRQQIKEELNKHLKKNIIKKIRFILKRSNL